MFRIEKRICFPNLFSVIHLNARSIPKNFDNFLTFLENVEIQFTAIGVSETWLNEKQIKTKILK